MNYTSDILLVLLIGMFAQSNNVNLATNQSFLFLLLLILLGNNHSGSCCRGNNFITSSLFPNQTFTAF